MDLADVFSNMADQDRGHWHEVINPITGAPTGMRFLIAGPDSTHAHAATVKLADELADMADADGIVAAADREKARRRALAARVLNWDVREEGQPVPFSTKAAMRVLVVRWVEEQIDAFAADRRPFFQAEA